MRTITAILAIFCYASFFTACKKDNSPSREMAPVSGQHIPLTANESFRLQALMQKEPVKDLADFLEKIKSAKSSAKDQKIVALSTYPAGDASPSTEFVGDANWVMNYPNYQHLSFVPSDILSRFDQSEWSWLKSYQAVYQELQTFAIRHNQILTEIPYVATVTREIPNRYHLAALSRATNSKVAIRPVGGHWGVLTQSANNNYVNFGETSMGAHAEAQEERTIIRSTSGKIKISNGIELEVWKAGVELEADFTIQSAENIYNQYTMSGEVTVAANGIWDPYINPVFDTYAMINCTDYGILLND